MGILTPSFNRSDRPVRATKKSLAETMSHAANEFISSPEDGARVTQWQAVVDRLYKTAIYAKSDKDATSAAKVIAERLFGRAPVQKQEDKHEIPAIIFAERGDTLEQIAEKASRAEADPEDYEGSTAFGVQFEDGSELLVEGEDE